MARFPLALFVLAAAACNPATAKDSKTLFPELTAAEDGSGVAVFGVTMEVNAAAREHRSELEVNVGGLLPEGASSEVVVLRGFLEEVASGRSSDSADSTAAFEPDFGNCDPKDGYEELEDGGCATGAVVIASYDAVYTGAVVGFFLRTWADKEWDGDPESLVVTVDAEQAVAKTTP